MPYKMAEGPSLLLGAYGPGTNPPPLTGHKVVKVSRAVARRAYYAGAMMYVEEYGNLVVFKDPETGLCYAQPSEV